MKSLMNGLSSYFSQDHGANGLPVAKDSEREIVFDYINPAGDETSDTRPADGLDRKLVGFMYADIADYTRLTEQDEEGSHHLITKAIEVMMSHIGANEGRIAHLAGDAILAEFRDADSALHCAINVQLAARQWNANLPFDRQVLFRIGVYFGDVISERGDIDGNAVNLAARLEPLASSGGICVSESLREKLEEHLPFNFIAMGQQYVKNISVPVQTFRIEFDHQRFVDTEFTGAVKVSAVTS